MSRLKGKVALVTGATGGIGEATARRFAAEGASVMLVGRSDEKLKDTEARLAGNGSFARFVADATDEAATAAAVQATVDAFGGIDVLFANAGTEGLVDPIDRQTVDTFEGVLGTNVIGVWLAIKHSVEPMKKRGGGSIIATSSIAGLRGFPGTAPYIASKHAVCGLVKTAALELGESGIRVNAIAPGPIDNRMLNALVDQMGGDDPDAVHAGVRDAVPMKRYGSNEEVANLALFLASDESSYCNGGTFTVDGGYMAG